jgi:S-adenosyl-L-methionine hydrolase (adenosine-forming)
MIFTVTDFGSSGPYLGQMRAVMRRAAQMIEVVDLVTDAPCFAPDLAAYLVPALSRILESGDVMLTVIDPGVGGRRAPVAIVSDGRWYVGPDNGLFELVLRRNPSAKQYHITWRPKHLSASFHGRDLFAPVAAQLAIGSLTELEARPITRRPDWPDDLPAVVYIDGYGNAMTGLRAQTLPKDAVLVVGGHRLKRERTFADVVPGDTFWYENSSGLAEIAANGTSAAGLLGLALKTPVEVAA